ATSRGRTGRGTTPGRGGGARDTRAGGGPWSRLSGHEAAGAGELDHLGEAPRLRLGDGATERRQVIVAAALGLLLARGPGPRLDHKAPPPDALASSVE